MGRSPLRDKRTMYYVMLTVIHRWIIVDHHRSYNSYNSELIDLKSKTLLSK